MSAISFRVFAATAGVLFGLGGFTLACQLLASALITGLGEIGGLAAAAGILSSVAFLIFLLVRRPSPEVIAEAEDAKSAVENMIAGLPGEAFSGMIRKHPVTAILSALTIGYTLVRDPPRALRKVQNLVHGLL